MDGNDRLLTVAELAQRLATSENTARKLCELGIIPAVNVCKGLANRRWRICESDAEKFLASRNSISAEYTREDIASLISLMRLMQGLLPSRMHQ